MKKPRYTDARRYPHGYTPSHETNIRRTLEREKKRLEDNEQERAAKVRELKGAKK